MGIYLSLVVVDNKVQTRVVVISDQYFEGKANRFCKLVAY